ncbi:MAG: efflux RND transporter permease subunit, partial [Pseudomonadota bacterium]
MKQLVDLITRHPLVVLALFVAGSAALGWQARHFEIDASADTLLSQDNEHYIRTRVMNQRFAPQEFLLVAYAPRDGELFSARSLADLRSLSEQLLALERVESVRSILNVPLLTLMEGELGNADAGTWTHEQQQFSREQLAGAFAGDPIYENLLINAEQSVTALQVLFSPHEELEALQSRITDIRQNILERALSGEEQDEITALQVRAEPLEAELNDTRLQEIESIRAFLGDYEEQADIYMGGAHVLAYQLIDIIRTDLFLFGSLIAGMVALVLLFFFGSFRWVLLPVLCCGFSVLLTMGLFGLLGLKTTVISSNFIALQLILTLAIVIHLIVQYRELNAESPELNQRELISAAFLKKVAPCFFAGLTTSVGFASLLFTGIQPVIAFGWMMIIAMSFSITVSLLLFPALMALFPREKHPARHNLARWFLQGLHYLARRNPGVTLLLCLGALAGGIVGTLRLDVENSFINYFSESTDAHRELSFIDRE